MEEKKPVNLLLNKKISGSGYNGDDAMPKYAVDGNHGTRWCDINEGPKWILIDLEEILEADTYVIRHAGSVGEPKEYNTRDFALQVSTDGLDWKTVDAIYGNKEDVTERKVEPFKARYIKLNVTYPTNRPNLTGDGHFARIYEFSMYNGDYEVTKQAVSKHKGEVTSVVISGDSHKMDLGEYMQLNAKIFPENAETKTVTWASADTEKIKIDPNGKIYAVGKGKTAILATSDDGGVLGTYIIDVDGGSLAVKNSGQTLWMIEEDGKYKNEILMEIVNYEDSSDLWAKIEIDGKLLEIQHIGSINSGKHLISAFVPEDEADGFCKIDIYSNKDCVGKPLAKTECMLSKMRKWTFYIAQDIHTDIGFTEPTEYIINTKYPGFYKEAQKMFEKTRDWEEGTKFLYPAEQSFILYGSVLKVPDADWYENILEYIKEGRITYPSSYGSLSSEGMGAEGLARSKYYGQRFMFDLTGKESTKVYNESDNPGFSRADIDALAQAGVKYFVYRPNSDTTNWNGYHYPKLMYIEGKSEGNEILFWNSYVYAIDEFGFRFNNSNYNENGNIPFRTVNKLTSKTVAAYQTERYPYDAILIDFTEGGDNGLFTPNVVYNIKSLNERRTNTGKKYAYPKFVCASPEMFFNYIEGKYKNIIPRERAAIENYWNHGPGALSYETGILKENHHKLPFAEALSVVSNVKGLNEKYPYTEMKNAFELMTLYDEHTFGAGPGGCFVDELFVWKRNTSINLDNIADKTLQEAMKNISSNIKRGKNTFTVYNSLGWERTDLVMVEYQSVPENFEIIDKENGKSVRFQKEEGKIFFVAENVPGFGYKCFEFVKTEKRPEFESTLSFDGKAAENKFFKVIFDETGSIVSITDKKHGRELVDPAAPYKMNQFIYINAKEDRKTPGFEGIIEKADISCDIGSVKMVIKTRGNKGVEKGTDAIERSVILYEDLDKIDFENYVLKKEAPKKTDVNKNFRDYEDEEGFFAFPFKMENFKLKHEMGTGDVTPSAGSKVKGESDFLYSSTTDFYTVHNWVDVGNGKDYGIIWTPVNSSLVQYGKRRSYWFDADYTTENPWIYSWVYNNKWWTNFQKTQPGPIVFKYSISCREGVNWSEGGSVLKGAEAVNGLEVSYPEEGEGIFPEDKMTFINIDRKNVFMTALKFAERNGEGVILRFVENAGLDTNVNVDISLLDPISVVETDIAENDIINGRSRVSLKKGVLNFSISAYGWVTLRVRLNKNGVCQVEDVSAVMDEKGCLLKWKDDNEFSFYEIYRSKDKDFTPGAGNYIVSTENPYYYDIQVNTGNINSYYYAVRGVKCGERGDFSKKVQAVKGDISKESFISAPENFRFDYLYDTRASFRWEQSKGTYVAGYKLYVNGEEYKDVDSIFGSNLDYKMTGENKVYTLRAYDAYGNLSEESRPLEFCNKTGEYKGTLSRYARKKKFEYSE